MSSETIPVLIIGAGPTGLNLANLLLQYKIPFRLIEQKDAAITTSNALAVQSRSLEMWQQMGVVEKALAAGKKILGLALHSGTKKIGEISFKQVNLPTQFPFILGLPQADSEHLLSEHLLSQGGKIERGSTLIDFTQTDQTVIAEIQTATGQKEKIACDWLIAADGSHSVVRKKLNLAFEGDTIPEKFIMADMAINANFNPEYFHAFSSPLGPLVFAPMPKFTRIIAPVTHDQGIKDFTQPTLADFEYIIANRSPAGVKIDSVVWMSHFVTHHRMINNYCHGRVIFAGDSAHIHSPVGGQGMNTGMQDTFNLAWKLAAVIQKKSTPRLLASYNTERHAVAKKVLAGTTKMTEIVTLKNAFLIALRNTVMSLLFKISLVQKKIIMNISELGISYDPNEIIFPSAGQRALHPELFQDTKHTLVLFTGGSAFEKNAKDIIRLAQSVMHQYADYFTVLIISESDKHFPNLNVQVDPDYQLHDSYNMQNGGMCIVRPDQYIGMLQAAITQANVVEYLQRLKC